jgi:hypothetical protein
MYCVSMAVVCFQEERRERKRWGNIERDGDEKRS